MRAKAASLARSPGHRLPLKEFFAGQLAAEGEALDAGTVAG
jgi:hypothetical protein